MIYKLWLKAFRKFTPLYRFILCVRIKGNVYNLFIYTLYKVYTLCFFLLGLSFKFWKSISINLDGFIWWKFIYKLNTVALIDNTINCCKNNVIIYKAQIKLNHCWSKTKFVGFHLNNFTLSRIHRTLTYKYNKLSETQITQKLI